MYSEIFVKSNSTTSSEDKGYDITPAASTFITAIAKLQLEYFCFGLEFRSLVLPHHSIPKDIWVQQSAFLSPERPECSGLLYSEYNRQQYNIIYIYIYTNPNTQYNPDKILPNSETAQETHINARYVLFLFYLEFVILFVWKQGISSSYKQRYIVTIQQIHTP